jgi:hypothetical protein
MEKQSRATQKKRGSVEQKHRIDGNKTDESKTNIERQDVNNFPVTETPYYPRMEEHATLLSEMPLNAQREEFVLRLHETYGNSACWALYMHKQSLP